MPNEGDHVKQDAEAMKSFGFIYADGSYSDERLPKGAMLVPRRPSPNHKWDQNKRAWILQAPAPAAAAAPVTPPVQPVDTLEAAAAAPTPAPVAATAAPAPAEVAQPVPPAEAPAVVATPGLDPGLASILGNTTTPAQ